MRFTFLCLLLAFLSSCAGPVRLSPRRCSGKGLWTSPIGTPSKVYEMKVWTGVSGATIELAHAFKMAGHKCEDVGGLEVIIGQSTSDFLISLIPFVSRKSVTFNFYPRPVIMEVTEINADN